MRPFLFVLTPLLFLACAAEGVVGLLLPGGHNSPLRRMHPQRALRLPLQSRDQIWQLFMPDEGRSPPPFLFVLWKTATLVKQRDTAHTTDCFSPQPTEKPLHRPFLNPTAWAHLCF